MFSAWKALNKYPAPSPSPTPTSPRRPRCPSDPFFVVVAVTGVTAEEIEVAAFEDVVEVVGVPADEVGGDGDAVSGPRLIET